MRLRSNRSSASLETKRLHVFSDEAGCFTFNRYERSSRYFLMCTLSLEECSIGNRLLQLKRDLIWDGFPVREELHASEDRNVVRKAIFDFLSKEDFRIDITILEKSKAHPEIAQKKELFYKYAWYCHFKRVGPLVLKGFNEVSITAAAIGTKRGQAVYTAAVNEILQMIIEKQRCSTSFPRSIADPCLQIADYCAWAIQRKWERYDHTWYSYISSKIHTEYDLWASGSVHYY